MGIEIGVLAGWLGTAILLGGGAAAATSAMSTSKKAAASADQQKQRIEGQQRDDIGNLTKEEASVSASRRAFRAGLIFTSPTGTQGTGSRGRSRLIGT